VTWDGEGIDPWLPERLAAEARLTAAERAMHQGWFASISRWLVKARRGVFANGDNPDPTGVFTAAPDWAREMDRFVQGPVKDTMGIAYRDLFGPGYKFDSRPAVVDHLANVRNRMLRTADDVFALVAGEVAAGASAGASIPDIAERVARVFTNLERWQGRATTVARTETVGALGAGRHDSFEAVAEELGEPMEHMWISTIDSRTRPSHAGADQMRVPLDEPFNVGGADLRYPGDPFGPAEEVINCRCSEIILSADEQPDLSDRQYSEDDWDEWNDARDAAPPSPSEPASPPPRDLETEARQRQARIDSARSAGNAAAELDEVVANLDGKLTPGGVKALEHRIAGQVARGNLPPDVADDLRAALRDGDVGRLSEVAWRHAESQGARRVGRAGDVVPFDRKRHQALDETPGGGTQVLVTRPGVEWDGDGGLLLDKARVDALDDVDLFNARAALALADRDALAAAPSGLGRTATRLNRQQRETLHDYQGTLYYGINGQLHRGEVDLPFADRIGHLDEAMDGSALTNDVVVYRGVRDGTEAFGDRFGKDLTGAEWTERRFVSTSGSERVARDFTYEGASTEHTTPTVMRLLVPKDTKGVALDNANQVELLLQRGLRMRVVTDHGDVDGVRRLDVEVLPATKASRAVRVPPDDPGPPKSTGPAVKVEIRPALQQARTVDAAAEAFQAEYTRITAGRAVLVDLPSKASPQTVRENFEGLLRALERFPDVDLREVSWFVDVDGTYARAVFDKGAIQFGSSWLRTANRPKYLRSLAADVKAGWHPAGFENPMGNAIHEFGHILHMGTLRGTVNNKIRDLLDSHAMARRADGIDDGPDGHSHAARTEVSGYASTDLDELVAEAFADVILNGPKASRLSRGIADVLEEAYKARVKTAAVRDADAGVGRAAASRPRRADVTAEADAFDARVTQAASGQDALDASAVGLERTESRLTVEQRSALSGYRATNFFVVNDDLRRGETTEGFADGIRHLDEALASSPLASDTVVYRGVGAGRKVFGDRWDGDLTGATWTERAYVSTTVDESVAVDITSFGGERTPAVLRLVVPKDIHAVQLSKLADALSDGEGELLLERGLKLRVVRDRGVVDGVRRLDVEVLPATKTSTKLKAPAKPKAAAKPKVAKRPKDVKLEVRPALRGGTPAKAGEKFTAEWKRITGRDIDVDVPKGASGVTLREHYEGLLRAVERFPEMELGRVDWWDSPGGEYAQVLAKAGGRPVIQFGKTWLDTTARTRYLKSLLNDAEANWSPPGFSSPGTVAMRQFGRVLHRHSDVDGDAVAASVKAALRRHAEAGDHRSPDGDLLQSLAVREHLSGTGANSIDDLVGDAFADVLLNGPKASALSREVVEILDKAYMDGVARRVAARAEEAARTVVRRDAELAATPKSVANFNRRVDAAAKDADALDAAPANRVTGKGLTPAQKSTITQYKSAGARDRINTALRDGKGDKLKQVVQIDEAMLNSALTRDVVVYRGMPIRGIVGDGPLPDDMAGVEWDDLAFVSTSARKNWAQIFAAGKDNVLLRVLAPEGTRGITVTPFKDRHGGDEEAEILLERGLRFRVVADRTEVGYTNILGEQIMVRVLDVEIVEDVRKIGTARAATRTADRDAATAQVPEYQWPTNVTKADLSRARKLIPQVEQNTALGLDVDSLQFTVGITKRISAADRDWLKTFVGNHRVAYLRLVQEANVRDRFAEGARQLDVGDLRTFKEQLATQLREVVAGKPIGVRVTDESVLRSLLSDGRFRTSFEADITRASGMARASRTRGDAEEATWGYTDALPPTQRPIYGYVMPDGVTAPGSKFDDILSYYGDVQVVLKASVRTRTTVTFADSLDAFDDVRPTPIDQPTWESTYPVRDMSTFRSEDFRRNRYIEAQVHGGVTVADIQEVVFSRTPTAATQDALDKLNIPWRIVRGAGT
jgi:hypothetical protein